VTEDVAIELLEGVTCSGDLQRLHLAGELPNVQVEHGSRVEAPSPYNKYIYFFVHAAKVTWPIVDLGDWLKICAKLSITITDDAKSTEDELGSLTENDIEILRKLCGKSNELDALESLRSVKTIISPEDLTNNQETTAAAVSFDDDDEEEEVAEGPVENDRFHYGKAATPTKKAVKRVSRRSAYTPKPLPPGYTMQFVHDELCDQIVRQIVRSDSFGASTNNANNIENIQEQQCKDDGSVSTTATPPIHTSSIGESEADNQDIFRQSPTTAEPEMSNTPPLEIVESKSHDTDAVTTPSSRILEEPETNETKDSSSEQDLVASKYRKMLQMGIPLVAIEFGMAINGVNPDVMTSVLEDDDDAFLEESERTSVSDHGWFVPNSEMMMPSEQEELEQQYYYYEEEEEILLDLEEFDDAHFILEEEVVTDEDLEVVEEEIEVLTDEELDELIIIEETMMDFEEEEWTTDEEDVDYVEEEIVMLEGESDDEIFEEEIVDSGIEVSAETIAAIEKVFANRKNKYIILQGPTKEEKKKVVEKLLANRKRPSTGSSSPQKLSKDEKKAAIEKVIAKRRYQAKKDALEKMYARLSQQAKTSSPKGPSKEARKAALEKLYRKRRASRAKKSVPQDASTDAKKAALETLYANRRRRSKNTATDGLHTSAKKEALERLYARRRRTSKKGVPYDASTAAKIAALESFYAKQRSRPTQTVPEGPSKEAKNAAIEKVLVKQKSETRNELSSSPSTKPKLCFISSTSELEETGVKRTKLGRGEISSLSVEEILKRMASSSDDTVDVEGALLQKIQESEEAQRTLEQHLAAHGVAVAEDIDYDLGMRRVAEIGKRMTEIGSAFVVHQDKKKQQELRREYFKLEIDMEKYSNSLFYCEEYQEEQARKNREWEAENHKANVEALKSLRRHIPPHVSKMSEAELLDEITPNGRVLPSHFVRKMKRSNVLQLIRRNPDDIAKMHPSLLTSMRTIGLTITERRALYEHMRPIGPVFESFKSKGKAAEKYYWYCMMKDNFQEKLSMYKSHVNQYGSPDNHQCPLIGRQCPVKHDLEFDYSGDYGWTDQPVYASLKAVAAPDRYDPGELAKLAEFHSAQKAMERDHALKEHYRGKLLEVNKAKGSCNTMEAIVRKIELAMERWMEDRMNIEMRKSLRSHDMKIKEAASFIEVLSECKLGIIAICSRAGMQVSGKKTEASFIDPRSALECFLADEVKETFDVFAKFVLERMERLAIRDEKIRSMIAALSGLLSELKERNAKAVKLLGATKGKRSRILKTEEVIIEELKEKKRAAEVAVIVGSIKREAKRKSKLRGETREFLFTLHKYLDCRRQMDAKYLEVDEFQMIAAFPVDVDMPAGFVVEDQQQSVDGVPVKTLDDLYKAAEVAAPIFHDVIDGLIEKLCGRFKHKREGISFLKAGLKARKRSNDKAAHDYGDREPGPGISWLYDINRASIEFGSATQVVQFVDLIMKEESIRVVKAKNRFKQPSLTGYRDLNIQFQLDTKQGFFHICEIQLHHSEIYKLDKMLKSHEYYEYFRHYFAGATHSLKDRLDDLKLISQGGDLDDYLLNELLERNENERRLERLGVLFEFSLCEYHFALGVYGKLFEIRLKKHGPRHPLVAKAYTNMANVLQKQGKLDEAMELYKASQEVNKRTHGEKHKSVANTYEHMAMILKEQDRLEYAIKYFEIALEINQEIHSEKHSSVANTLNNIAVVHQEQGNLDKALELYQKSLAINRQLFGDMHWTVAGTYNNMALILMTQSKLEESMKLHEKSLEIYRKTLGERHSDVAKAYYNMALVYKAQGNFDGAMELYSKSLEIDKKNLGEMHPSVARTYQSMALILQDQGEHGEAMKYYDKSLDIERKLSFGSIIASNMRRRRMTADTRKIQEPQNSFIKHRGIKL